MRVDATWSELPGRCLAVLRPRRCEAESEEQSGDGEAAVLDIGTEDAEDAAEYRAEAAGVSVVRASLGRSYSSLSLASFSLLSASSASGMRTLYTIYFTIDTLYLWRRVHGDQAQPGVDGLGAGRGGGHQV